MATNTVEKNKVQTSSRTKQVKKEDPGVQKASKLNTIIVSILISFIIGYIAVDYFVVKHRINEKVMVVNQKFDSLKVYLDEKLPMIDKAIEVQQKQVKDLQNMSATLVKK